MKIWIALLLTLTGSTAWTHVPALLLPIKGTPVTSYFLGQIDVSRAVYSELTTTDDIFIAHFNVKPGAATSIEILTPVCEALPQYERFQPSVLLIRGDAPWKKQGESNAAYLERLRSVAIADIKSTYRKGQRPKFYEQFAKVEYWVGAKWKRVLKTGLYAVIVYDGGGGKGTFTLGLNEKEAWTPDLYAYTGEILPSILSGLCNPKGFTGRLSFSGDAAE